MPGATTYAPDALSTLRESFALHLNATRANKTTKIYLTGLDGPLRYLEVNGMPTGARAVRREHVESFLAARPAVRQADEHNRRPVRPDSPPGVLMLLSDRFGRLGRPAYRRLPVQAGSSCPTVKAERDQIYRRGNLVTRPDDDPEKLVTRLHAGLPEGWTAYPPTPTNAGQWEAIAYCPGDPRSPLRVSDSTKAGAVRRLLALVEGLGLPPASDTA